MTFSQDGFLERGQQGQASKSGGISSNNFGGMNKIASPLNCPFEDSPDLLNIDVDVSGNLIRRKGTKIVSWDKSPGTVAGVGIIPFTTGLGYNFLINKQGTSLKVSEVLNDVTTVLMTKTNVFSSDASSVRANYVSTNEVEPRLIITTGVNAPIQLKFVEQQQVVTSAVGATSVTFSKASRFAAVPGSQIILFKDRVRIVGSGTSYNAGTEEYTVTGIPAYTSPPTTTFDMIAISWQWWAEAYNYLGDRFSASATRSNSASVIDRVISIPSSLRDSIDTTAPTAPYVYPIFAAKNNDYNDFYSDVSTRNPANRVEYAHCDGVPYSSAGLTTPSPLFITFGGNADGTACDATGRPQIGGAATNACPSSMPVVFVRYRFINFNGGNGWFGANVKVYVDGVAITQSSNLVTPSGTYSDYYYGMNGDLSTRVAPATIAYGIAFDASTHIGTASDSQIEVVNVQVSHVGSSGSSNRGDAGANLNQDGTWIAAYGLGDFANYYSGSFPTNVALYQGRLVFSGFVENSLRVVFSNQYDSVLPGKNFSHYQVDAVATAATDTFDLTLSSAPDDVTKALVEWQQSLFVMTRKAVFRISGGANAALTGTNRIVVLVSNIGLINSYSVCRTDKSVLYLSDTGVFDLSTTFESAEYVAAEKSIKIRPLFGTASNPTYESASWLSFDATNKVVFLGYPAEGISGCSFYLYVYNTFRESWTEYYTPGGFSTFHGSSYIDRSKGLQFGIICSMYSAGVDFLDLVIIRTGYDRYIDYAQEVTGSGLTVEQNIECMPTQRYIVTTTDGVREYAYDRPETGYEYGVRGMPLTNVEDLIVYLETGVGTQNFDLLEFEVDYIKTPGGKIYLIENPGAGKSLTVEPRLPVTGSDEGRSLYNGYHEELFFENGDNILFEDGFFKILDAAINTTEISVHQPIENVIVFIDNIFIPYTNVNYTMTYGAAYGGNIYRLTLFAPASSVVVVGQAYPTYYYSPVFTQETLAAMKRAKYLFAYFDNKEGMPTYGVSDTNVTSGQVPAALAGTPKQRLNTNLSLKYEEDDSAETYYDSYGFSDLYWDDALFDIDSSPATYRRHVMFKQPLLGISYSYQLIAWSYDETTFTLAGYQIVASPKGSRYINWSR